MHSFQPSRGRVLLEFLCALAIVASLVGAWRQTQASALLLAAGAAALLGMIRLFDLGRSGPAEAEQPQRIEFDADVVDELPAQPAREEVVAVESPLAVEDAGEQLESVEPEPLRTGTGRRKGGSRKSGGRRAPKEAKVIEITSAAEADVFEPALEVEAELAVAPADEGPEGEEFNAFEPVSHVPHAPLFEPEPFVRMPRQAFGRRGRL